MPKYMNVIINWRNIHKFGDLWYQHLRLRKKVFVDGAGWNIPSSSRVEWDQFDTDHTYYAVTHDRGQVVACARMNPTTQGYMISEVFPHLLVNAPPRDDHIWEATRYAVEPSLSLAERQAAQAHVIKGMCEFALYRNIDGFLGLMPISVYALIRRLGPQIDHIGPLTIIDGRKTCVGLMPVNQAIITKLGQKAEAANAA